MKYIIIIFFTIILLLNKYKKEHFYTLFNPFLNDIKDLNFKYYKSNDLNILIKHNNNNFIIYILKLLIANNNVFFNVLLHYEKSDYSILKKMNNNKYISNISIPILNFYNNKNNLDNIRFLNNTNNEYIIPITNNTSNFENINDVNNQFNILLDIKYSSTHIFLIYLFKYLNKKENIHYKFIFKEDKEIILDLINKNDYKLCFISTVFPSTKLTNTFLKNNNLKIINYENLNLKNFFNINLDYTLEDFNLSNVSKSYLPTKINNEVYTIYKPFIKLVNFKYGLFTNKNIDKFIIYKFTKNYFNNIKIINKNLLEFKTKKLSLLDTFNTYNNNIELHKGALQLYIEKGFITYENNVNCKNFVSKLQCNKENLMKYNF